MDNNKILLIDDEEVVLEAMHNHLRRDGYKVYSANNGKDGLDIYYHISPILIILDLKMPVMDGFDFLKHVNLADSEQCAVIVLTGHGIDEDIEQCFALGISAFLRKPFNIYELKGLVRNTIALKLNQQGRLNEIAERKRAEETIAHNYHIQNVISTILKNSLEPISLSEQLKISLKLILSLSWLSFKSKGSIFLVDDDCETLTMKAQSGLNPKLLELCAKVPFGTCLCGKAASTKKIVFSAHVDEGHEIHYKHMQPHGHYCTPIISKDKVLGVINLYVKKGHQREKTEEEFLLSVANTLAGIIERKKAEEALRNREMDLENSLSKLRKTVGGIIQAVALTVEAKDPYTAGHQRRVADLARAIANEMGLPMDQIDGIRMAGAIHDLGKISLPSEILSKPGKINKIEFNLIKLHSQVGYDILKTIDFPWPVAQIVYQHHERLDGSGYPLGLTEKDILTESRILSVADVVEAMASHRPYRPTLGIEKALQEIERNRGKYYDPTVVDACLKLFKEKQYKLE